MKIYSAVLLIIVALIAVSCGNQQVHLPENQTANRDSIKTANALLVKHPGLVLIWPDSIEMEKMKAEDSNAFYTATDDYAFYCSSLMQLADSMGIPHESTTLKKIIFTGTDGRSYIVDRTDSTDNMWQAYMFNGKNAPQIISTIDADRKMIDSYFK